MHPCLDVIAVTEVQDIPKSVFNITQAHNDIQDNNSCLTDSDYDYIVDKIKWRNKIDYEININVKNDVESVVLILFNL